MEELTRKIIELTQEGLSLVPSPYAEIASTLGISEEEVIGRLQKMQENGIIRRIGVVPNHYALGYKANGMTVWNVSDENVDKAGEILGGLSFVTHCYKRPRFLPDWPYNLFAMIHAKTHDETAGLASQMAETLGELQLGYQILYSSRILKKTGLRI